MSLKGFHIFFIALSILLLALEIGRASCRERVSVVG